MVGISAELDLEIKKLVSKLGQADARVGRFATEGTRKGERFAKGFEGSVSRGATRAGGAVSRFFAGFRGAARAAVGIAAITTVLVIMNRRFPVIGQVAGKTFRTLVTGANGAAGAASNLIKVMQRLKTAGAIAVGVMALARAYRALRGSGGGDVKAPRLPSGRGGGGGSIMGQVFGGTLLGGLASRGIANAMDGARNAIAAAVGQVKSSFMKAAGMEQVQISFGVLLGSDAAGTDMIKQLEQRAAKTSFEMPSLTDATQKLLQYDVAAKDILPTIDMLGDISGGNAQKLDALATAFGQMSSTGRLMGQDLLQMINAGFNPLQEISKRTGKDIKTLKKEMEMGDIDAGIVVQAFRDATSEGGRFFGMMDKQSKSAVGLMSTLRDAWSMNMLAFGQPVMESIKPFLEDAIGLVERMKEKAVEFGEKFAAGIDFARAALQEFSGGELLALAGEGLKLAFMEAVNLLARGLQAVFKAAQDAEFMGELETRLESFADKLKIALLEAIGAAFMAMRDLPGIGEQLFGMGLSMKGAAADVERDARVRDKKKPPREEVNLGEKFVEYFKNSGGIFDTEEARAELAGAYKRIKETAGKNKASREGASEEAPPPSEGGATGSGPISYGGNSVQNQVNALFGRPMEAEAKRHTGLLASIDNRLKNIETEKPKTPRPSVPGAGIGVFGAA